MKKICILILSIFLLSLCVYAEHDERFFNALTTCSQYTSNGTIDTQGVTVDYSSQILGKTNNKCVYKKHITFSGIDSCVTCEFTQKQINELTRVMRAYKVLQDYTEEDIDLSNPENVKDNPVIKVWNKYIQDPSTCKMVIEEIQN